MEQPKYRYLLCDLDGTLFDFEAGEKLALETMWKRYNIPNTPETIQAYQRINHRVWSQFEKGEITLAYLKGIRFVELFQELGIEGDGKAASYEFLEELGHYDIPYPDTLPLLKELKSRGYYIAVITNGVSSVQNSRLSVSQAAQYFDKVFISEDYAPLHKPEKAFFDLVFKEVGITDKSQSVVIGDSLASDITGGINANIDTVWFNPKNAPGNPNIKPTYEINKITQLLDILPPLHK